ncbi:MAG: biotin--[acetyl-CoA-carboxylase] ligase [Treponema sp.]|nr:biotin--[acetyl-CoA-carboxylase] ligase [Treponema sp.]
MVNKSQKNNSELSSKAQLVLELRKKQGETLSGSALAKIIGISRVAVWKGIQSLVEAGYPIETTDAGYSLNPHKDGDFLYPWEFGKREAMFRHFESTGSTMDRAREFAEQGLAAGTVIIAEKQKAGRGRNGRTWASRQGGLFFTILDRPALAVADYTLPCLILQIAVTRTLSAICGKQARLRWPNDIYIDQRKIAGVMTEISGEGDRINWLALGVGINVNNPALSGKSVSCAEIIGHPVSRSEVLLRLLAEIEQLTLRFNSGAAYSQGNRLLAVEWNSLADCIGAKAAVLDPGYGESAHVQAFRDPQTRVLARGIFSGIDPAGRCIITSEPGQNSRAEALYFNPGPVSLAFFS